MNTKVVSIRHDEADVYIGRPSRWGNPFVIGKDGDRQEVIQKHKNWLMTQIRNGKVGLQDLAALHGKRLGCYCAPEPCHGDFLAVCADMAYMILKEQEETT